MGPGSSVLPCRFIGERWYGGASTGLLQLGGDAWPLSCPDRAGHWGGCFIPGPVIWGQWLVSCAAGTAKCDGNGRGRDLWSDPASSPRVRDREEPGGQAIRARSDPV